MEPVTNGRAMGLGLRTRVVGKCPGFPVEMAPLSGLQGNCPSVAFAAKQPPGNLLLKKISLGLMTLGSTLTGFGLIHPLTRPPTVQQPLVQTPIPMAPALPEECGATGYVQTDNVRMIRFQITQAWINESSPGVFRGSLATPVVARTADGQWVSGNFGVHWEMDLNGLRVAEREGMLRQMARGVQQASPEKVRPEWLGETPSDHAFNIMDAYYTQLMLEQVGPMVQERFAEGLLRVSSNVLRISETKELVDFKNLVDSQACKPGLHQELAGLGMNETRMTVNEVTFHYVNEALNCMPDVPLVPFELSAWDNSLRGQK